MVGPSVAVIDDDPGARQLLGDILQGAGARVFPAANGDEGLDLFRRVDIDALFVDLRLPGRDGICVIREARRFNPQLPSVVVTGHASIGSSVEALRLGVCDFVIKPFEVEHISSALTRCIGASKRFKIGAVTTLWEPGDSCAGQPFVAASSAMLTVAESALRLANTDVTLFIEGEAGVGKTALARTIHAHSSRPGGPFIGVPCDSIHEDQVQALLFGTEAPLRDGTVQYGLLEQASGGTLFLRNFCKLPPRIQRQLVETVQRGRLRRVGGSTTVPIRTRLIGGISCDASVAPEHSPLLRSLYTHFHMAPILIPPLRNRTEDIRALVMFFAACVAKTHWLRGIRSRVRFSQEAWDCLLTYEWPGNVRELARVVDHAKKLSLGYQNTRIGTSNVPRTATTCFGERESLSVPQVKKVATIERRHIQEAQNIWDRESNHADNRHSA